MKFKFVFDAPNDFEKGCCANCPLSIIDFGNDHDLCCVLNCSYDECPLEKVNESRKGFKLNHDTLYELVKAIRKYAVALVCLDYNDASKLDSTDWQSCILDIATSLAVIETRIKNWKDE